MFVPEGTGFDFEVVELHKCVWHFFMEGGPKWAEDTVCTRSWEAMDASVEERLPLGVNAVNQNFS